MIKIIIFHLLFSLKIYLIHLILLVSYFKNQAIYPFDDEVALVCNEEGKINGLMPNRYLLNRNNGFVDCICGDFFLCYAPCDSENFESMPDNLIDKYIAKFSAKGARI